MHASIVGVDAGWCRVWRAGLDSIYRFSCVCSFGLGHRRLGALEVVPVQLMAPEEIAAQQRHRQPQRQMQREGIAGGNVAVVS